MVARPKLAEISEMALKYMKEEDRLDEGSQAPGGEIDPAPLLGTWYATDKQAGGVAKVILTQAARRFMVHAFGADEDGSRDWGEVEGVAYGHDVTATEAMSFTATYDFGFMATVMAAYAKQGILVLDTFNTFRDDSGRAPYFTREFFHQ